ncbi:MAG TPA: c-type cytochrome [Pyrinomonadaceae bacterium]|jgi:mono/diheme cytochrome c family protein
MAGKWKRRLLKAAGYGAAVVAFVACVGITVTVGWRPFVGPKARPLTARRFEPTPRRLERGRYLVESVSACFACHTTYDPKDPVKSYAAATNKGGGGSLEADGAPWLIAPNITPDAETGAGRWTDDMLARAIREGIGHDGRALFPAMPYQNYRNYSDEDVASIVVYLRSIPTVRNKLPQSEIPFPLSRLINTVPEPLGAPVPEHDRSSLVKHGEYVVKTADCAGCHTPRGDKGAPIPGMDYAGGNPFDDGRGGAVAPMNLTPDATGISYYDEALFVKTIRTGHVGARALSPHMPWWVYRNMTDEDLKSAFAYLRTLRPVEHRVDNTEKPTFCKLCKQKHGLGERN